MRLKYNDRIGLQIAGALLLDKGEISLEEMKAIPFFSEETDIKSLFKLLQNSFHAEVIQKKIISEYPSYYEEKIKINSPQSIIK